MKKHHKEPDHSSKRLIAILIVSLLVIVTGAFFTAQAVMRGDIGGAVLGGLVATIILVFAIFVYMRGRSDLKRGLPIQDERSRKVLDKASSRAFYLSLYLLLIVGFISDELIDFRDVSQATGITVGMMALIFAGCWAYYNRKEL